MKKYFIFFMFFLTSACLAQSTPIWTHHFDRSGYYDADVSNDGKVFSLHAKTDTNYNHCASTCAYSLLLNADGTMKWENYYDTTNGCIYDMPTHCSTISGFSFSSNAISIHHLNSPDSLEVLNYDSNGSVIYDN